MTNGTSIILSTSPQSQSARKLRRLANFALRQPLSYRRTLRNNTGKELDPETGLYYFGARYLDPKTSRWLSGDPALGEYLPSAPVNEEAKKRNQSLPGQGGVFNYVNLHIYHYAGNNPVKYVDPTGEDAILINKPVDADPTNTIEHMGAFFQDENNDWNFFYWGVDVKYEKVEDASIFESMEKMNAFLLEKDWNVRADKLYRDAVYIEGDFTAAHIEAGRLKQEYIDSLPSWNGRGVPNQSYNLIFRNCGQETMKLLMMGTLPDGRNVGRYMHSRLYINAISPNANMDNMQALFKNKNLQFTRFSPMTIGERVRYSH